MLENPGVISEEFIKYAGETEGIVLDIGAAYGVSTIPALQTGATVIANDLDGRHLQILEQNTPSSHHLTNFLKGITAKKTLLN